MGTPAELKYTQAHEWARREHDGTVTVGITQHAQDLLGDLVFVENPAMGSKLAAGEACAVVESVKAAADVHAPVSGEVIAVNHELENAPEKINQDAYGAWMFKIKPTKQEEFKTLLNADQYQKLVENGNA
ncbi:MAG TPA: glycine cleavage system protein GcvH [Burkholderiales bacterium]|nr:glycine cleavage system protein GcvH [Burkholderiales bacterium]